MGKCIHSKIRKKQSNGAVFLILISRFEMLININQVGGKMQKHILLVEDDRAISEMVETYLVKEGFIVDIAPDGEEAIRSFRERDYDLILLDLMLPKLNGMDLLKKIREKSMIPILIISAKDSDVDKALGLEFGADDYVPKPFSMIELLARVRAAIRRATQYSQEDKKVNQQQIIHYRDLSIDIENFLVSKNGMEVKLTSKEWEILKLFIMNPNRVFTKEQIYRSVWGEDYFGDENIINVHMSRLREKIEDNKTSLSYIKTLWGIGYKLGDS